jgi:hypothetical protein
MIGTPIHFLEPQMLLHERMCTLLTKVFGDLVLNDEIPPINGLICQGLHLKELLAIMNQHLPEVISFSASEIEKVAGNYADIITDVSKLTIGKSVEKKHSKRRQNPAVQPAKPISPELIASSRKEFYDSFYMNLYFCQSYCSYIFKALYAHKFEGIKRDKDNFNQVISYFLLLACILNLNMLMYQTHPIYKEVNIERMQGLFKASRNWTMLLESFHLNYGQGNDFDELRTAFVKRMIVFKQQLFKNPKFFDLLTDELLLPLSIEEMNYHVAQKNTRAQELGIGYHGHLCIPEVNTLYIASFGTDSAFFKQIRQICANVENPNQRAQFLYYYNEENGNVDVFDVKHNAATGCLEIMNVHVGNSCAHHDLLSRIELSLKETKIPYQLLACQANLGHRTQTPSLYAFKISSLLTKRSFTEVFKQTTSKQPLFSDDAHHGEQKLDTIPTVRWFPIETLGDKAVLLISSLARRKALLGPRFEGYQQQYGLSEMIQDDPATVYHYADDYRKRLAHRYHQRKPFATLSVDALKAKVTTNDDGQLIRRGASNIYKVKTREFEFLVNYAKEHDQEPTLHFPVKEKDYTPLHLALRGQSAKKATILLNATKFTEQELNAKNKDEKSAKDYFAESKDPAVKENPVLKRFLQK